MKRHRSRLYVHSSCLTGTIRLRCVLSCRCPLLWRPATNNSPESNGLLGILDFFERGFCVNRVQCIRHNIHCSEQRPSIGKPEKQFLIVRSGNHSGLTSYPKRMFATSDIKPQVTGILQFSDRLVINVHVGIKTSAPESIRPVDNHIPLVSSNARFVGKFGTARGTPRDEQRRQQCNHTIQFLHRYLPEYFNASIESV